MNQKIQIALLTAFIVVGGAGAFYLYQQNAAQQPQPGYTNNIQSSDPARTDRFNRPDFASTQQLPPGLPPDQNSDGSTSGSDVTPQTIPTTTDTTNSTITNSTSTTSSTASTTASKTYTAAEVAAHSTATDCWTITNGKVYNVTSLISSHPGGASSIVAVCGRDGTSSFERERAHQMQKSEQVMDETYLLGTLQS